MAQHTVNIAGDKHEFDPKRWTTTNNQNGATYNQNGATTNQNGAATNQNGAAASQNGATTRARLPKRDPETGINILIIGAGMGGLMTTLECWRKGQNIVGILERNEGPVYSGLHRALRSHGDNTSA